MSAFDDDEAPCLVTNYTFDKRDYLIKMYVRSNILKLSIIDNTTSEKWVCSYNAMYIEELTRRTGNYKKFSVFVTMLNSGILKTNSSVRIELMSHCELETLCDKNKHRQASCSPSVEEDPRKYIILVYTVEFDKIHYPLPLEYCGMPNPRILQKRIQYLEREKRRLEEELSHAVCTKCSTQLPALQEKVNKLTEEKKCLEDEVKCLAAELGSHYTLSRFPKQHACSGLPQEEKLYLYEKIKNLQLENLELAKTLETMNKRLNPYLINNKQPVAGQMKKCQKCAALPVNTKQSVKKNSKIDLTRKIFTPSASPTKRNIFPKYSTESSRSSASSGKNTTLKERKSRRKITMRRTRIDGNLSSSSGDRNNIGQFVNYGSPRRKTGKSINNMNMIPAFGKIEFNQLRAKNIDRIPQANTSSNVPYQMNHIVTPEELRKQINDLVRVVESWSNKVYGSCSDM